MYAQIFAESETSDSRGKTMRVWARDEDMEFDVIEQSDRGGIFRIRAHCRDRIASGWKGGVHNPITRQFFLDLNGSEVERLVCYVLDEERQRTLGFSGLPTPRQVKQLEQELESARARISALTTRVSELERKITVARDALK